MHHTVGDGVSKERSSKEEVDEQDEDPRFRVTDMNETGVQISAWITKAWLREAMPGIAAMVDAALMK